MIPSADFSSIGATTAATGKKQPGLTWRLDTEHGRIAGMIDGLDAVRQMVEKTLRTERYAWLIYNWDYGSELQQYLGKNLDFVAADIQRSIEESLLVDDRVLSVEDFAVDKTGIDSLAVTFRVISTEGEIPIQWGVTV